MPKKYSLRNFNRRWFVSHRGCDTSLAKWVDAQLRKMGQHTILDAYDFLAGQSFKVRMSEAFHQTDHTICLLTENFFSSPWCKQEFDDAMQADPGNTNDRLVIVLAGSIKDTDVPESARDYIYIDLRGQDLDEDSAEEFEFRIDQILKGTARNQPALNHKVKVIVAKFSEVEQVANPGYRWPVQLRNELTDVLANEDVSLIELKDEIEDDDQAFGLLKSSGAHMVIWGLVASDLTEVHYTFNRDLGTGGFDKRYLRTTGSEDLDAGLISSDQFVAYIRDGGDSKFHLYFLLAHLKYEQGAFEESVSYYTLCIEAMPHKSLPKAYAEKCLANIFQTRGSAKMQLHDYRGAIEDFNLAIRHDPQHAFAYDTRGQAKIFTKDLRGAVSDLSRALELMPSPVFVGFVHTFRGSAKYLLGDYRGSLEDFNAAIRLIPNYPTTYFFRGRTYRMLGDRTRYKNDQSTYRRLSKSADRNAR